MNAAAAPSAVQQIAGMLFAVLLVDEKLVIAQANHAAEDLLGRSNIRLVGMELGEACGLPNAALHRFNQSDSQLVARRIGISPIDQERVVNFTLSPISSPGGWRVVTISDAGRDDMGREVDERRALAAPAILAHEIKNPLAAIKGASQLLARKLPADAELTALIDNEVARIARLIDRMQALGSNMNEAVEPVNLHQTVRKAVAGIKVGAPKNIEFSEMFDPSLPDVLASPDALEQVLGNLLANAVEACRERSDARVCVRTRYASGLTITGGEGVQPVGLPVELSVGDNGAGVSPELAALIFEPFVTSRQTGQGLGLALVKKLVGDMGGRISHDRDTKKMTTQFRVHLPVAAQP